MAPHFTFNPEYDQARDFKGYGENSINPQWPNNAKIAVSFVINYEEVCYPSPAHPNCLLTFAREENVLS
jgi:hypothetical protein